MGPTGGFADRITRDFGQGGKRLNNARGAASFDFSFSSEITFSQPWLAMLAGILGTESTPAEQTVGEDDYLVNMDVADATEGLFYTVAYTTETNQVMVVPSFTPMQATLEIPLNGAPTFTCSGVADQAYYSTSNTVAELKALVPYDYEEAEFGGTGHYMRFADFSTSVALDSGDEKDVESVRINFNRAKERLYGARGALSKFTKEPLQLGLLDVTVDITLAQLNSADFPVMEWWQDPTFKMGEIYLSGQQINGGVDKSLKIQLPRLKAKGALPGGMNVSSNNGLFKPTMTFDCLKSPAAPAGMTGVTELLRVVAVSMDRAQKWGT